MNYVITLILVFLTTLNPNFIAAQQSPLYGIVTIQNSNFNNQGKTDFVQNAQVESALVRTKPTVTDANGTFKLVVISAKSNEKLRVKIVKEGYQVLNPNCLSAVVDQADTVRICMAKTEDVEAARLQYFTLGKTLSESAFKKKMYALNAELISLRNKSSVDGAATQNVENAVIALNKNAKKCEEIAQKLALTYSIANLDDASLESQKAFRFFQKSDLDSALWVLENADLITKLEFFESGKKNRIQKGETIDAKLSGQLQRVKTDLGFQADFYQLKGAIDKADSVYQLLLKSDPTNGAVLTKYGVFLADIYDVNRAKEVFEKGLLATNLSAEKIELMIHLGALHNNLGEFKKAEKMLSQATDMADWEIINNKEVFEPLYALTQSLVGQSLTKNKDFNAAESAFKIALKFHQEYATKSPAKAKDSLILANTFNGMALNYLRQKNYAESMAYFDKVKAIYEKLSPQNVLCKNEFADLKNAYAQLYLVQKDTTNALKFFTEENAIYTTLMRSNAAFEMDYMAGLTNLANLYVASKNYKEALPILDKLAATQKRYVVEHPNFYEADLEKTQRTLGNIHWAQKNYALADSAFKRTAELHPTILKGTPQYKADFCVFYDRFGAFYREQKKYKDADNQYVRAIEMRKELVEREPMFYADLHQINLQNSIDMHDSLLVGEIFEAKVLAHKAVQNNCRTEMLDVQNKLISAYEKSTLKDKAAKINAAYGNLAAYYLSLNKIKEAELTAQKQEGNAALFLVFVYAIQNKMSEAQLVLDKIIDKKAVKNQGIQWSNAFYRQQIISWDVKTKVNKWLENNNLIGALGN
jgi:tetratricopeptide (TPR) repeat protein